MSKEMNATFGGGCFWCVEASFKRVHGVSKVVSGYAGGETNHPTYEEVCSGNSGHAEVVQLSYDPEEIRYEDLLSIFFSIHDPTQVNRQGPDVGPQYRSIILYHNEAQKRTAEAFIEDLDASGNYAKPIATEISELDSFYPAEKHHQNYYEKSPNRAYCQRMIRPKLKKLEEKHEDLLAQSRTK